MGNTGPLCSAIRAKSCQAERGSTETAGICCCTTSLRPILNDPRDLPSELQQLLVPSTNASTKGSDPLQTLQQGGRLRRRG